MGYHALCYASLSITFHASSCQLLIVSNQRKALDETKAMFPQLRQKIEDAKSKLEAQLVS